MTAKEYILKVLSLIKKDRSMAEGLHKLVESNNLDKETIAAIVNILRTAIEETTDKQSQQKLTKAADVIQSLHDVEKKDQKKEEADLQELEDMFKDL